MKDAKVISLRGRLAGYGGTPAVPSGIEDPQLATILDRQAPGTCSRCGAAGTVDFVDLVAGLAKAHCPACQHYWDEPLVEPEDETARANLALRRESAERGRSRR